MRKLVLLALTSCFLLAAVQAQDRVGCTQLLEDAREAYEAGMVELVPELLNDCLESSGLSGSAKQDAYILVITAYLFDYLPDEADALMTSFLRDFPDYQAKTGDPSEFVLLLESRQAEMQAQQVEAVDEDPLDEDPEEEVVQQEDDQEAPEEVKPQPKPRKKTTKKTGPGIGLVLGTNFSMPQMTEPYSVTDPNAFGGSFSMGGAGFHAGVAFNLPLSRSIDLGIDLLYLQTPMAFDAQPFEFASYSYEERQNRFSIPVTVLFHLNPDANNTFYLRLGLVPDYMLGATASAVRSATGEAAGQAGQSLDDLDVSKMRSGLNLSLTGGAGMRFALKSAYIFVEARYQHGLIQGNEPGERYSNQDLIWQIYHVDSDFKLHYVSVSAGMVFNLFK